jgi:alkanesulfonate monooxygenase SsuD/methylene tetrahydromethanopterin reductase-like flavin-dependent oxidoreductase (luciferase family)
VRDGRAGYAHPTHAAIPATAIDEGPFSSSPASGRYPQCWGERIAFENPDSLTLLGALAAWTDRVRLVTTVIVPQLHDPVMLAKALATGERHVT